MSGLARSPRLLKGALVGIDLFNPVASVVTFQYNPATVTRTVKPRGPGGGDGGRAEAQRLTGPPEEDIKMDVEIDATDALEKGDDDIVQAAGIYPQLSALEMLAYPKSLLVSANTVLLAVGTIVVTSLIGLGLLLGFPNRLLDVHDPATVQVVLILVILAPLEALDQIFISIFAVFSAPGAIFFRKYLFTPALRLGVVLALALTGCTQTEDRRSSDIPSPTPSATSTPSTSPSAARSGTAMTGTAAPGAPGPTMEASWRASACRQACATTRSGSVPSRVQSTCPSTDSRRPSQRSASPLATRRLPSRPRTNSPCGRLSTT
jgi:hypothetical protein